MVSDTRLVRLSILDSYGVRWSRETFARDLLQNFFDAAPDFRDVTLHTDLEAATVEIRGPTRFSLELLAYIGATTKNDGRTAGGFGEGFKICALVGVRDFGLRLAAGSGDWALTVCLEPVALGRELCYRVRPLHPPEPGSFVRLEGCDAATLQAFTAARELFRHADNPRLQTPLVEDRASGVALYLSPRRNVGEIFYRRQMRGEVRYYSSSAYRALTLVHDGVIEALEGDRDRRDLPARPVAKAIGDQLDPAALHQALLHLMPYWEYGQEVLNGLIEAAVDRKLRFDWPRGWLARPHGPDNGLTEFARRTGFKIAVVGLGLLGMKTPLDVFSGSLETREATDLERARFQVVADLYRDLLGRPSKTTGLEVFDDDRRAAIKGQHLGKTIVMASRLLAGSLTDAAGTGLHELAHEAGGETSPAFLKRLTRLMDGVVKNPAVVRAAMDRYSRVTAADAPSSEAEAAPIQIYEPTEPLMRSLSQRDGILCWLFTPPAFLPAARILEALGAASQRVGVPIRLMRSFVTNPAGALTHLAPGLPTLFVGPWDLEIDVMHHTDFGYRPRTWDGALCPPPELLDRALRRAAEARMTYERAMDALDAVFDRGRKLCRERLGRGLYDGPPPTKQEERRQQIDTRLHAFARGGGIDLEDRWPVAIRAAGRRLLERTDETADADTIWPGIERTLRAAMDHSRRLRREDPTFDDASELERGLMVAAQAVAVLAYVQEDEGQAARAEAAFGEVRALSERLLDFEIDREVKPAILLYALERAGLGDFEARPEGVDPAVLRREFDHACATASRLEAEADGGRVNRFRLDDELEAEERRTRQQAERARQKEQARRNEAIRQAWEAALTETGSEIEAARLCLEEAARQQPEGGHL